MKKYKINREKIALWLFVFVAALAFVIMRFPQTPEVDKALNPEKEEPKPVSVTKIYDVPMEPELQIYINELCEYYDVDMPIVLAVIGQESNYNPDLVGDGGDSIGLMQIQPEWHTERMDKLGVTDLTDPYQNVAVGIDFIAELLGEGSPEWALTAYNAGEAKADFNQEVGITGEYAETVLMLREEIGSQCIEKRA